MLLMSLQISTVDALFGDRVGEDPRHCSYHYNSQLLMNLFG